MTKFIFAIDTINTWVGKVFGWCIVLLTFATSYEVFARYVFKAPTEWAYDAAYILYGTLFMMAGAYTLARNGHVRGDWLYREWPARRQAAVELVLYFIFFFPGVLALVYAGFHFAKLSWLMHEHSAASPNGPPIYHFKTIIPLTGILLVLQGMAEAARCVMCLRTGAWPARLHDVEELETAILHEKEYQAAHEADGAPKAGTAEGGR